ncbi:photosystem II reaction center W protein, chloroplastic-like [Dorcoceras hygrometricum]|uniref:Photosystem II reaction center W protein, chloroplastic-like n=1 Tax=Dorcoceras hygrometricum TaxID=472368 RepID=A0A2Z7C4W2_9LAMI|nr:photosystem II reaction center W protein, chloroplastic-like [Dorcoceras hygrometricum]
MMVAISAKLKINWAHVQFQTLVAMVSSPGKQSQGYAMHLSFLLEKLVKVDLAESVALHPLKVLKTKSVPTYLKKNQDASKSGQASKASVDKVDTAAEPKKENQVKKKLVVGSTAPPAQSLSETSSDADECPLAKLVVARLDSAMEKEVSKYLPLQVRPSTEQASNQPVMGVECPTDSGIYIYSSNSNDNKEHQVPDSSGLAIVQYKEQRANMEAASDFAQADADDQTYLKYESELFRQVFYRKMDEVVATVNTSQLALKANLVHKIDESHPYFAAEMTSVRSLAEMVNCLKELRDAKKGECGSSKKETSSLSLRSMFLL